MRIYSFGDAAKPTLLLLPGTCCHWKGNFGGVLPLLEPNLHVLCVSYDGFDETEPETTFPTMLEETRKIEDYVNTHCGGHLHAAYGCSLGGSFVGLLAARQRIRLDIGILGSSDMDQAAPWKAKLMTDIAMPLLYPLIRDGKFKWKFLNDRIEKRMQEMPAYTGDDGWGASLCIPAELQEAVLFGYGHAAAGSLGRPDRHPCYSTP